MSDVKLMALSLSCAFCWVNYINPLLCKTFATLPYNLFAHKPFTCVKCMCGWLALLAALGVHGFAGVLYLPAGVFAGALFEAACMRWL